MNITTHILDVARGKPASGVKIDLEFFDGEWKKFGSAITNEDGRVSKWDQDVHCKPGTFRLTFFTQNYFENLKQKSFYPQVTIAFEADADEHYHVPLLLSPYGYSTYRGS